MTRNCCAKAALATVLALVCCASVQAQIDFSVLDKYKGVNNQRPSGGNPTQSSAKNAQGQNRAAANAANDKGLAAEDKGDWATAEAQFKEALEATPNDSVILQNLAVAQTHIGGDAYRRGDYAAAPAG